LFITVIETIGSFFKFPTKLLLQDSYRKIIFKLESFIKITYRSKAGQDKAVFTVAKIFVKMLAILCGSLPP
jgi:hypothetical protein